MIPNYQKETLISELSDYKKYPIKYFLSINYKDHIFYKNSGSYLKQENQFNKINDHLKIFINFLNSDLFGNRSSLVVHPDKTRAIEDIIIDFFNI